MNDRPRVDVAILNTTPEVADAMAEALTLGGLSVVTLLLHEIRAGTADFVEFIERNDPRVVLLDVAAPYVENWRFCRLLLATHALTGRPVLLTTTNKAALERYVGQVDTTEILSRPYSSANLLDAVHGTLAKLEKVEPRGHHRVH